MSEDIFPDDGEVGRALRAVDWGSTALGDPAGWPGSLRTAVRMLLGSRFSMWMCWGPELTFFCNDAYRRDTLGSKFPWALGRPAPEVWSEVWPDVESRVAAVLERGESTWDERLRLFLERSGYREETYHTFSYSPLTDDHGAVAGLLCVVAEVTDEVITNRRMMTLRDLAVRVGFQESVREQVAATSRVLAESAASLPFHLVYLYDEDGSARLAASGGVPVGHPVAVPTLSAPGDAPWPWPGADDGPVVVGDLGSRFEDLPTGAWSEPPTTAVVLPVRGAQGTAYGFFVVGLNPYRPFDDDYADFVRLVGVHLGGAVTAARAHELERLRAARLVDQYQDQLERSRELLDQAQRLARIGSWSVDLGTGRLETSAELLRILERDRGELEGAGSVEFLSGLTHPDEREFVRAVLEQAAPGEQIGFEVRMLRPDGSEFHASVRGEVVGSSAGGHVLRGSLQDVSERRRTEAALAVAHATAEAAAREHEIAGALQRSLLPERTFDLKHLEVATFYRPGVEGTEVGGDWYDVIELDGGHTALVMGDVMGHGVRAAAVMGQLRTAVRAYARIGMPPRALMKAVDSLVWDLFPDQIVTCVYAEFSPDELVVRLVNAGHVPPLLLRPDGSSVRLEGDRHPPLGLGHEFADPALIELEPGASLVLYTDGLVERRGQDIDEGIERLRRVAGSLSVPLSDLPEAVAHTLVPEGPDDDVAVLVARVPG